MSNRTTDNIEDIYPLSPVQRGILFHSLEGGHDGAYFFQLVLDVSGGVDFAVFREAWQRLIARHAILRTAFVWKNLEQPLQVVQRSASLPLEVRDDTPADPAEWERFLADFLREDRERGLPLARAPLMRLTALRTPRGSYTVVWGFHHLIADAWSQSLLLAELFRQYDAVRSGVTLALPGPPSFRSYIEWLQRRPASGEEAFWRQSFEGMDTPARLRVRCAPEPGAAADAARRPPHLELSEGQSSALVAFARARQVTPNALVQAAWSVLLAKQGGSDDVVFGVTVATRPAELPDSDSIIGPMINTVPLRVRVSGGEPVGRLLERVQQAGLDVLEHASASLTSIRQWAGVAGPAELFESIVVFENAPFDSAVAERVGSLCDGVEIIEPTNYPLALKVTPGPRYAFTLVHDAGRFGRAFAERTLGHLRDLIDQICDSADAPVGGLRLGGGESRRASHGPPEGPEGRTAAELFAAARDRDPQAAALDTGGRKISYAELDALAASLASSLRACGVRAERHVAVCLPPGARQVVAALAIWKAGGVYAPVDLNTPDERLSYQLRKMSPAVVLCREGDAQNFADFGRVMVVEAVESQRPAPAGVAGDARADAPSAGAYLIHTSGSTGRPKGVVVTHAGLENLARAQAELLGVGPGARVLQFSSPSFDASVFEIALALFSGATLVQAEENAVLLGEALLEFAGRAAVTHAVLPPSLLAALPEPRLPHLHTLIVAGEACPPEVVRRWAAGRKLVNAYGPTEATIWSTAAELGPGDEVTIGRPIRGVQAHVLDLHGQPLPPGVVGELALGGPGIARGYMDAPAQTADRFTPDFLGGRPGARLYRTGDLAYYTEAGELYFCGRADHQIKLRGYRIELGEIEAVLREHPDVSAAAAVLVPDGGSGAGSLVAFAVAAPGSDLDGEALKSWAADRLPEYSVPARALVVAEMPLTRAGKVDRPALAGRAGQSLEAVEGASAPSNQLEALLAHFWGQIAGLAVVDVRADLFDQRGDSLRVMELVGRVGQDLGVTVPIEEVFDSPTLTALAAYVLREADSAEQLQRTAGELLERAGAGERVGVDV